MSEIVEGIGGMTEGALSGRAVEPAAGEGQTKITAFPPEECANCGAMVTTTFCPQCGQKRKVHRSLAAIANDLIHGVLHLDGKFWLTLPLLVFKPGKLTRRYINGERAKFVSPMAMFLFSVFAMFAIFQMLGLSTPTDLDVGAPVKTLQEEGQAEIERLSNEVDALPADDPSRAELENDLSILQEFVARASNENGSSGGDEASGGTWKLDSADANLTGMKSIDDGLIKKWNENPSLMLYKLQANGYKFSWLLIPLSIPFVWLVFAWKRRFKAYDHAIFVTYSLSFMSLLFIAVSLAGSLGAPIPFVVLPLLLIPPVHIYKHLRGTYEISRFSAFWRLMVLSMFIWIVLLLFLQSMLVLGAF